MRMFLNRHTLFLIITIQAILRIAGKIKNGIEISLGDPWVMSVSFFSITKYHIDDK